MRKVLLASPGVLVRLMAVRGSTSVSVLYVLATGPPGGLSGPRAEAERAAARPARERRRMVRERCMVWSLCWSEGGSGGRRVCGEYGCIPHALTGGGEGNVGF